MYSHKAGFREGNVYAVHAITSDVVARFFPIPPTQDK